MQQCRLDFLRRSITVNIDDQADGDPQNRDVVAVRVPEKTSVRLSKSIFDDPAFVAFSRAASEEVQKQIRDNEIAVSSDDRCRITT